MLNSNKGFIKNEIRQLNIDEIKEVSGGFWGPIVAIAIAAVTAGCATMPKRRHD